jgi:hypothetical protein
LTCDGVAQHAEDVAADARQVRRAELGRRRRRRPPAGHVAELVAERVVGLGEVVEVDQRQGGVAAGRSGQAWRRSVRPGGCGSAGRSELVVEGGALQVGDQFDVVEADRDVAANSFEQARRISDRARAPPIQEGEIAAGLAARSTASEIARRRRCGAAPAPVADRAAALVPRRSAPMRSGPAVGAGGGQHPSSPGAAGQAARTSRPAPAGRSGRRFAQHAGGAILHAVQRHQLGAGAHDLGQAAAAGLSARICS